MPDRGLLYAQVLEPVPAAASACEVQFEAVHTKVSLSRREGFVINFQQYYGSATLVLRLLRSRNSRVFKPRTISVFKVCLGELMKHQQSAMSQGKFKVCEAFVMPDAGADDAEWEMPRRCQFCDGWFTQAYFYRQHVSFWFFLLVCLLAFICARVCVVCFELLSSCPVSYSSGHAQRVYVQLMSEHPNTQFMVDRVRLNRKSPGRERSEGKEVVFAPPKHFNPVTVALQTASDKTWRRTTMTLFLRFWIVGQPFIGIVSEPSLWSVLHVAALQGNPELLEGIVMMAKTVSHHAAELLRRKNADGMRAIDVALSCSQGEQVARRLLELHDESDVAVFESAQGIRNCLHFAVIGGSASLFQHLLMKDASAQQFLRDTDEDGLTPFALACAIGRTAIVDVMSQVLLEMDERSRIRSTRVPTSLAFRRSVQSTRRQLDRSDSVSARSYTTMLGRSPDGDTPLMIALKHDHEDVAMLLLQNLPPSLLQVGSCNNDGATALLFACETGCEKAVEFLLQMEHGPLQRARDGSTALHVACKNAHVEVVRIILEDMRRKSLPLSLSLQRWLLTAEDSNHDTPYQIAFAQAASGSSKHMTVVEMLAKALDHHQLSKLSPPAADEISLTTELTQSQFIFSPHPCSSRPNTSPSLWPSKRVDVSLGTHSSTLTQETVSAVQELHKVMQEANEKHDDEPEQDELHEENDYFVEGKQDSEELPWELQLVSAMQPCDLTKPDPGHIDPSSDTNFSDNLANAARRMLAAEAAQCLRLPAVIALALLELTSWNLDKCVEAFVVDSTAVLAEIGAVEGARHAFSWPPMQNECYCATCMDIVEEGDAYRLLTCGHIMCKGCWSVALRVFIEVRLSQVAF
jgi:ankyrin repeat protein